MIRKSLILGVVAVALASCGNPSSNPCPPVPAAPAAPTVPQVNGALDPALPVVMAKFSAGRSGGFSSGRSGSSFSRPSYRPSSRPPVSSPSYRYTSPSRTGGNTTIIQNGGGGGSNGLLWGLGGYLLGQQSARKDAC